jgi:hypothetical protein
MLSAEAQGSSVALVVFNAHTSKRRLHRAARFTLVEFSEFFGDDRRQERHKDAFGSDDTLTLLREDALQEFLGLGL